MTFLAGLVCGVSLMLAIAFVRKPDRPAADRWLIALLSTIALIAAILGNPDPSPQGLRLLAGGPLFLLAPACLLLYVRRLTGHHSPFELLAALPGLVWGAALLFEPNRAAPLPPYLPILGSLVYPALAWVTTSRYRDRLFATVSTVHGIELRWLRWTILGVAIGTLAGAAATLLAEHRAVAGGDALLAVIMGIVALQLVLAAVFGLEQRLLPPLRKHESAGTAQSELVERLGTLLQESGAYREPNFRIDDLASLAGLSVRTVSTAINAGSGQNFFRFVNGFRVTEAKRLLRSNTQAHRTILDIAFDAGFPSKSSFNRIFKDRTGMTPGDYRQQKARQ